MQDFEKLGLFYLGREYDLEARQDARRARALRLPRSRDPRGLRRHDRQRQDRPVPRRCIEEAAIDGVPVIAIDPKGDLGNLLLTFPGLPPAEFRPWIDEDEARRAGLTRRRVRGAAGGALGATASRRGGRTARASQRLRERRRVHHLHAGQPGRACRSRSSARSPRRAAPRARRCGAAGGAGRRHGDERAVAGRRRRRRRAAASTRCCRRCSAARLARRAGPRSRRADPAGPDPAVREGRRRRSRVVLPVEGALRAGDAAERRARVAGLRAVARRGAARPAGAALHAGRASRASRSSRSPTSATPSGCSSCRCC